MDTHSRNTEPGDGGGSSAAQAVIVDSVAAEYAWMRRHCPGFRLQQQVLQRINGKPHDVHILRNDDGEERTIYFDISEFYGKV